MTLRVEGMNVQQGDFTLAADFSLPKGSITAVIGPSGAGKSTLLDCLAGFQTLNQGQVFFDDREITFSPPETRPLSILFQDHNLFPHMTAFQNVALGMKPNLRLSQQEREKVDDALAQVGLQALRDRKPAALSGGEQARVALARTILRERPLLLLDEPFKALDPALRQEMLKLVRATSQVSHTTVLIITHDPEDARRYTDLTLFINKGHVFPVEPSDLFFADPPRTVKDYLGYR